MSGGLEWHSAFICEVQGYAGQGGRTIDPSAPLSDDLEFKYFLFVESDQVEDMISSEDLPDNRTCFRKPNLAGCRLGQADIDRAMRVRAARGGFD